VKSKKRKQENYTETKAYKKNRTVAERLGVDKPRPQKSTEKPQPLAAAVQPAVHKPQPPPQHPDASSMKKEQCASTPFQECEPTPRPVAVAPHLFGKSRAAQEDIDRVRDPVAKAFIVELFKNSAATSGPSTAAAVTAVKLSQAAAVAELWASNDNEGLLIVALGLSASRSRAAGDPAALGACIAFEQEVVLKRLEKEVCNQGSASPVSKEELEALIEATHSGVIAGGAVGEHLGIEKLHGSKLSPDAAKLHAQDLTNKLSPAMVASVASCSIGSTGAARLQRGRTNGRTSCAGRVFALGDKNNAAHLQSTMLSLGSLTTFSISSDEEGRCTLTDLATGTTMKINPANIGRCQSAAYVNPEVADDAPDPSCGYGLLSVLQRLAPAGTSLGIVCQALYLFTVLMTTLSRVSSTIASTHPDTFGLELTQVGPALENLAAAYKDGDADYDLPSKMFFTFGGVGGGGGGGSGLAAKSFFRAVSSTILQVSCILLQKTIASKNANSFTAGMLTPGSSTTSTTNFHGARWSVEVRRRIALQTGIPRLSNVPPLNLSILAKKFTHCNGVAEGTGSCPTKSLAAFADGKCGRCRLGPCNGVAEGTGSCPSKSPAAYADGKCRTCHLGRRTCKGIDAGGVPCSNIIIAKHGWCAKCRKREART